MPPPLGRDWAEIAGAIEAMKAKAVTSKKPFLIVIMNP
jgi:hypothetical protein